MRYYWVVTTKELTAESFIVLWIVFLVGSCDIVTGMLDIWEAYTPMLGFVYNKELLSWGLHSWKSSQLLREHHTNSCFKISSYCSGIGRSLEYLLTTEQYMFRLLNNFWMWLADLHPPWVWNWDKNFCTQTQKPRDFCYACSVFFESWMLWILLFCDDYGVYTLGHSCTTLSPKCKHSEK